nr:MAG TPA: SITE SPECIFIC RECOMBINASE XERD [Caudoviricetes sp.]
MGQVAKRSLCVTDDKWQEVNPFNRDMVQEFLDNKTELSIESRKAYLSAMRTFFYWVYENCKDKPFLEIKKRDFMRYLNWLTNRGLSESAIKLKKASVSSFCNYITMMYEDDYPTFHSFVTPDMKVRKTGYVHEKQPLTPYEYQHLCDELEKREEWQKLAYLVFSYSTGCRRAEAMQLLKEVVNYEPKEKEIKITDEKGNEVTVISRSYQTHVIRCKGASIVGKPRKLKFGQDCMDALKKWIEVRGEDDCPYMFVTITGSEPSITEDDEAISSKKPYKNKPKSKKQKPSLKPKVVKQVSKTTFNGWCTNLFSDIVGRRVHPHLTRESRATNIVVYEGKSAEVAQKLLGHNDVSTTKKHYIIVDDEEDASDEAFI